MALTMKELVDQYEKALTDPNIEFDPKDFAKFTYVTLRMILAKNRVNKADRNHNRWAKEYNKEIAVLNLKVDLGKL